MNENNDYLDDLIKEQKKAHLKRNIRIIFIIGIIIIIVTIIIIIAASTKKDNDNDDIPDVYTAFKQNTFFFFDPVTNNPCNESNYWTPFDQSTTCYRFVSLVMNDTNKTNTIRIMLDHNIGISNYSNYKNVLKNKTSNWSRYKDKYIIDIIDEKTIFSIMKLESKPNKTVTSVKPIIPVSYYYSNSFYILNGKSTNERGYWIKDIYDEKYSYAIDVNGYNTITSISTQLGIRPVLIIKKSLLNYDHGLINITDIISNGTKIHIKRETSQYEGFTYGGLQGMTVTNDKLIFMSANNNNPTKSVMYSYKLNDFENPFKKDYSNTGHGNGMTYNPKTDKVLALVSPVNKTVYEYNGKTLVREKEYDSSSFPSYSAIGYDYKNDLYIGFNSGRVSLYDAINNKKLF